MTIKEYMKEFIKLGKKMNKEIGPVGKIEIYGDRPFNDGNGWGIDINFTSDHEGIYGE